MLRRHVGTNHLPGSELPANLRLKVILERNRIVVLRVTRCVYPQSRLRQAAGPQTFDQNARAIGSRHWFVRAFQFQHGLRPIILEPTFLVSRMLGRKCRARCVSEIVVPEALSGRCCTYYRRDPRSVVPAPPSASAQASRGTHSGFVEGASRSREYRSAGSVVAREWIAQTPRILRAQLVETLLVAGVGARSVVVLLFCSRSSYRYLGQIALQKRSMR
jgi:hypothetical protein